MRRVLKMKKIALLLLVFLYTLSLFSVCMCALAEETQPPEPGIYSPHAKYMLMVDVQSDTVMYEANADATFSPGGLTKILTAITAIENYGDLSKKITVKKGYYEKYNYKDGNIGLKYDEVMSAKNMIEGLLLYDAGDCAYALAHNIGYKKFIKSMNDIAKKAGATNSAFSNPDGCEDDNHKTTLRDMYLITKYAMQNEFFSEVFGADRIEIGATNKSDIRILFNKNQFLSNYYSLDNFNPNINGAKSYTNSNEDCGIVANYKTPSNDILILCAKSDIESPIVYAYDDVEYLIKYATENYSKHTLLAAEEFVSEVNVPNAKGKKRLLLVNEKEIRTVLENNHDASKLQTKTIVNEKIRAPIKKGDVLGKTEIYYGDKKCGSSNLLAYSDVESSFFVYMGYIGGIIFGSFYFKLIIIAFIAVFAIRAININKGKRK
ncbi:MAG: D-alanyl-D-alanine carboxypeptidase [Ruminococcaceae bacterium]|nr:D-alanyl-D-alanine carboxypeptidase [Oscillospiraceae bacterium]